MKINTTYSLRDKVYINELKVYGKVSAIFFDTNISYKVRYFDGRDPRDVYFDEDELSFPDNKDQILGFQNASKN